MKLFVLAITALFALSSWLFAKDAPFEIGNGMLFTGYHASLRCPNDGSAAKNYEAFAVNSCKVDMWPDTAEYVKNYETQFSYPNGEKAYIFSSYDFESVDLHFKWMRQYGIDGAFLYRKIGQLNKKSPEYGDYVKVLSNAKAAAEQNKVGFALSYYLDGEVSAAELIDDWQSLSKAAKLFESANYMRCNAKPLVCIWGAGFTGATFKTKLSQIEKFAEFLKSQNCSVMFVVHENFRTLNTDSAKEMRGLLEKYADVIMPWNVGRCSVDKTGLRAVLYGKTPLNKLVSDDIEWCSNKKIMYFASIYAGFSWYNKTKGKGLPKSFSKLDKVPRKRGALLWAMARSCVEGGAQCLYIADFDDIGEATAIYKLSSTPPNVGETRFVALEDSLKSDWYLHLASRIREMLKSGETFNMPAESEK